MHADRGLAVIFNATIAESPCADGKPANAARLEAEGISRKSVSPQAPSIERDECDGEHQRDGDAGDLLHTFRPRKETPSRHGA